MRLSELVETSRAVTERSGRKAKIERLAALLRRVRRDELAPAVAWLSGSLRQGRIGIGGATLRQAIPGRHADAPLLEVAEVDRAFSELAAVRGTGSGAERLRRLGALLSRATPDEQDFLLRLLGGGLRQGALEGLLVEAVARAAEVPAGAVRRAVMLHGDLGDVARTAREEGAAGLARYDLELFRPVQPMLAQTAEDVPEILERLGEAAFDYKLDGARIQVHKAGDDVRVFTRRLNDVTAAVPEVVEAARRLPVREAVLDGETLALREDGTPLPFQVTMRRFGRRLDVERMRRTLPLRPFFFDALHLDGRTLIDLPTGERLAALDGAVPAALRVPERITADPEEADAFFEAALRDGHEGLVAKSLEAGYDAGRRGGGWLKLKPAHTLDLVVLAAEWGSGRRRGWLSNLHLGARDPQAGGFVMLGKTFKGLTDALLEWQTARFLELELARDAYTVYVRPELVVEIAFGDVQESPQYPAGLALRFARVKRYRPDKSAAQADTVETVRALHRRAAGEQGRPAPPA